MALASPISAERRAAPAMRFAARRRPPAKTVHEPCRPNVNVCFAAKILASGLFARSVAPPPQLVRAVLSAFCRVVALAVSGIGWVVQTP